MYNPYSYILHRPKSSVLFVPLALRHGLLHTHLLLGVFSPTAHPASILLSSKASVLESYPSVVPKENQYKHSNKLGKDSPTPTARQFIIIYLSNKYLSANRMVDIILVYIVLDPRKLIVSKKGDSQAFLQLIIHWDKIIIKKHATSSTATCHEENNRLIVMESVRSQGKNSSILMEVLQEVAFIWDLNNLNNKVSPVRGGGDPRWGRRNSLDVGTSVAYCQDRRKSVLGEHSGERVWGADRAQAELRSDGEASGTYGKYNWKPSSALSKDVTWAPP